MRLASLILIVVMVLVSNGLLVARADESELWGKAGEKWNPASRLPDFSYAGYRCGETAIPNVKAVANVKSFGAKGDGQADDSDAFLKAIAATNAGAIEIPAGRYKITKIIEITKPNIVLRGAGPDKTILFCPIPLNDIRPDWGATTTGDRTSNYSWAGGFIWIKGSTGSTSLAAITSEASRGATALEVSSGKDLKVGQRIEIRQSDPADRSLTFHLYSNDPGNIENLRRVSASLVCRVTAIEGNTVRFDRPLRWDVKGAWKPEIRTFNPTVSECGIENLGFEFPVMDYKGHFTELGFNPIALSACSDCWVRNIRIMNCDSGIFIGSSFSTIQNIVYETARKADKDGRIGHHGVYFSGNDNLYMGFDYRQRFIHDISVAHCCGNVSANGKGTDLCFDHHRYAPYENLYTNIDLGAGTRMWFCGGGAALGKHSGARETFWNIRAAKPQQWPNADFGPDSMNLVALTTTQPSQKNAEGKWFEAIDPVKIVPANLYEAQLARRLREAKGK